MKLYERERENLSCNGRMKDKEREIELDLGILVCNGGTKEIEQRLLNNVFLLDTIVQWSGLTQEDVAKAITIHRIRVYRISRVYTPNFTMDYPISLQLPDNNNKKLSNPFLFPLFLK